MLARLGGGKAGGGGTASAVEMAARALAAPHMTTLYLLYNYDCELYLLHTSRQSCTGNGTAKSSRRGSHSSSSSQLLSPALGEEGDPPPPPPASPEPPPPSPRGEGGGLSSVGNPGVAGGGGGGGGAPPPATSPPDRPAKMSPWLRYVAKGVGEGKWGRRRAWLLHLGLRVG